MDRQLPLWLTKQQCNAWQSYAEACLAHFRNASMWKT